MKKLILGFLFLLWNISYASSPPKQVIFFGDSLSDNGNIYRLLLHFLPKSPPYFQGRFSNGPTWAELVGQHFYKNYYSDYQVYAYGGATALLHPPSSHLVSLTTLRLEVYHYLLDSLFKNKKEGLFAIWIGGNDYLFNYSPNVDEENSKVVKEIGNSLSLLIDRGAEHFIVINLPDLSKLPNTYENSRKRLYAYSTLHNLKLTQLIEDTRAKYPNVRIAYINVDDLFATARANPEMFNNKYHVAVSNVTDACWQGGYFLKNARSTLHQLINEDKEMLAKGIDKEEWEKYMVGAPDLNLAYRLGQAYSKGIYPCPNADNYLFWDEIHPSRVSHQVLAQIVLEQVKGFYS